METTIYKGIMTRKEYLIGQEVVFRAKDEDGQMAWLIGYIDKVNADNSYDIIGKTIGRVYRNIQKEQIK